MSPADSANPAWLTVPPADGLPEQVAAECPEAGGLDSSGSPRQAAAILFIAGPQQPAHIAAPEGNDAAGSGPSPDPGACGRSGLWRSDIEITFFVSDAFYPSGRGSRLKGYMSDTLTGPAGGWLKHLGSPEVSPWRRS